MRNVASQATGGSGTEVSPWTGWDTAIEWAEHTEYHFRKGHYAFTDSPNFLKSGIALIGKAGTYLHHTGSGDAFVMDAGEDAGTFWIQNVRVENLTVLGNVATGAGSATAATGTNQVVGTGTAFLTDFEAGDTISFSSGMNTRTRIISSIEDDTNLTVEADWQANYSGGYRIGKTRNGFFLRGVRNGIFSHLSAKEVGNAALWSEACVTNILENFRLTYHEPEQSTGFLCRSKYGLVISTRAADWSTCWTVTNPVIEGVYGDGIWLTATSYGCTIINGTSEGHVETTGWGVKVAGTYHTIINTDVEANASAQDFLITGSYNLLLNVFAQVQTTISGSHNVVQGGAIHHLTMTTSGGACYQNELRAPKLTGTFTDGGTDTRYTNLTTVDPTAKIGVVRPVYLSLNISGAAVATDAKLADVFLISATKDFTLSNPTNPFMAMTKRWMVQQDGTGGWAITFGNAFMAANGGSLPALVSAANAVTLVEATYHSSSGKWLVR